MGERQRTRTQVGKTQNRTNLEEVSAEEEPDEDIDDKEKGHEEQPTEERAYSLWVQKTKTRMWGTVV